MRKYLIVFLTIMISSSSLLGKDYQKKLLGKWKIIGMYEGPKTMLLSNIPGGSATFIFNENAKGKMILKQGTEKDVMQFTWKMLGDGTMEMAELGKKADTIHFGFFGKRVLLIKNPGDTILLEKITP
ncbi:MAG: hypothetical protein AAF518_15505 [Spirochaetota bacterium]